MPFVVTPAQRDRWLLHMMNAVDMIGLEKSLDDLLRDNDAFYRSVSSELTAEDGVKRAVAELEEFLGKSIRFQADEQYQQEQYDVVLL